MPDWKTRLAVSYRDEDGNEADITPIDSFSPSFSLNAEVLHSLEQTHIGVVYTPDAMSFSMTVKAMGDVAAQLTALALQGKRFDVTLQESEDGSDWSFKTIVMQECIITSANPTEASISGVPTATFSGFSLAAASEPKTGAKVEIP
ncbi:hypothetical protein N836_24180 [Leptolyngbya sp. Heron Island J]|uniref:hypothetical protein n=1 Tax=Leptolyngbya sp. Heron Island J TaxID=1385935 RepID=UPI0003B9C43C|nr:hypothetical protein [Leptolyngbya sp. Heron Island J]ESA32889.1 hypothetical protein N836_24180 [Leptolyngbya sp. Heron Island J]